MNESFGRQIWPVGDVDGDGRNDWILTHRRCDTSMNGYAVVELLLYHGVSSGLPDISSGKRIGPTEIGADCSFIASGDWDADGYRDLAISQRVLEQSYAAYTYNSSVVVYWNDGGGGFSVGDTTHLTPPRAGYGIMYTADQELWANAPSRCDLDGDDVDDLLVVTHGRGRYDSTAVSIPRLLIYRGSRAARWGRDRASASADWQYWNAPFYRRVSVLDHDGDGALDIGLFRETNGSGSVAVLYGRDGALPDTSPQFLELVPVDSLASMYAEFIDVTGDRIPELIVTMADTVGSISGARRWLIYVGRRGQRLIDQYGSGNDAPDPGSPVWWGRPWTYVLPPQHFDGVWNAPFRAILDPGDVGLDGVGDFCVYSYPTIICYNGGRYLDSKIDSWMQTALALSVHDRIARLGPIDVTGIATIGVSLGAGGVAFIRADRRVPRAGTAIRLPDGTGIASIIDDMARRPQALEAAIAPNPASLRTTLRWSASHDGVTVVLADVIGRELRRWLMPAGVKQLDMNLIDLPPGRYVVLISADGAHVSLPLIHAE